MLLLCSSVKHDNDIGVASRVHTSSLEHAKKCACEFQTNSQDHACYENWKEAQSTYLKLASELLSSTLPTDANNKSTIEVLAEYCDSIPLLIISNDSYHCAALIPKERQ